MLVIHYPTAYKALDCYLDLFNEQVSHVNERIRNGMVLTAKELIRIYGISLLKSNVCKHPNTNSLPSLQTNNQQLAKLVKCSSRTIQRHITKLQEAGIIIGKKFHGTNSNYELWINPDILLINTTISLEKLKVLLKQVVEKHSKKPLESGFSEIQTTICPHTYSCNTRNNNNILIGVENSTSPNFSKTGNTTGNTGEIAGDFSEKQKKVSDKKNKDTGEIATRVDISGGSKAMPDAARANSLIFHTDLLWLMARNLLYRNMDLTGHQIVTAKKLIQKLYEPAETKHLAQVHGQYVERISLVSKYIKKDPQKRFVPLPYIYFDTNNPNGFVGTKKWYKAAVERRKEIERELTLKRVIRKYQNNDRKEVQYKKPQLQLFRECENTLGKLNDPALIEKFHSAVLQYETFREIRY